MAAGNPWYAAKYSYKVQDHFPDQDNPFWEFQFFANFGTPPGDDGDGDGDGG